MSVGSSAPVNVHDRRGRGVLRFLLEEYLEGEEVRRVMDTAKVDCTASFLCCAEKVSRGFVQRLFFNEAILHFFESDLKLLQVIVHFGLDLLQRFVAKSDFIEFALELRLHATHLRLVTHFDFFQLRLHLFELSSMHSSRNDEVGDTSRPMDDLPCCFKFLVSLGEFSLVVASELLHRCVQGVVLVDFDVQLLAVLVDRRAQREFVGFELFTKTIHVDQTCVQIGELIQCHVHFV